MVFRPVLYYYQYLNSLFSDKVEEYHLEMLFSCAFYMRVN
jgi:hypothetical protein